MAQRTARGEKTKSVSSHAHTPHPRLWTGRAKESNRKPGERAKESVRERASERERGDRVGREGPVVDAAEVGPPGVRDGGGLGEVEVVALVVARPRPCPPQLNLLAPTI
eukprot:3390684-Rhodomonas_salina.1